MKYKKVLEFKFSLNIRFGKLFPRVLKIFSVFGIGRTQIVRLHELFKNL